MSKIPLGAQHVYKGADEWKYIQVIMEISKIYPMISKKFQYPRLSKKIVCDSYAPAAPPPEILKKYKQNEINEQEYEQEYMQYLNTLDAQKVIHHLRKLARNKDIVLLCYEKSEDFCHRHIFVKWLKEACNMQIQICGEFSQI